jgi:hypothetical protein
MHNESLLSFVRGELEARKGTWPSIAKAMEPGSWESYYSWLAKMADGRIADPGINKVQALADYFRAKQREAA